MRSDWNVLPEAATRKISEWMAGDYSVIPAPDGDHAEIAAAVTGPNGRAFIKAASTDLGVRSLRYELKANESVAAILRYPPAVTCSFEVEGWLLVGTEHLDGAHPDLSPGSPDLDLLERALTDLQRTPAPAGEWHSAKSRLGFFHPAMAGEMLVHSDLNPSNLIIAASGLRIVDWAYTTRAASWVELALLVQWLVGSGHTAEQAENWLARFPAWSTGQEALDEFATRNAAKWVAKSRQSAEKWVHDLAVWTSEWASYRR
ncbi:phosphotransferase family protein [Catenuloplanes sp. NPDC051500]|uniref:phosphotransferase family protein n=1 Tax=Catenuloplanes sp. NPDC051500 TaxID=3363959 RepID=UPI00379FF62C